MDGAKLDNIEANADVTDETNVAAAGATIAASANIFADNNVFEKDVTVEQNLKVNGDVSLLNSDIQNAAFLVTSGTGLVSSLTGASGNIPYFGNSNGALSPELQTVETLLGNASLSAITVNNMRAMAGSVLPSGIASDNQIYYNNAGTPAGLASTAASRHFINLAGYDTNELEEGAQLVWSGTGDAANWVITTEGGKGAFGSRS